MIQQTLVLIKPDATKRHLIGEIISRYEKEGLEVVEMKFFNPVSEELAGKHYPSDDEYLISIGRKSVAAGDQVDDLLEQGKKLMKTARDYFTSGPLVAMVLKGEDAIKEVRRVTGYTDPSAADKGTIRGDLGEDSILQANKEGRIAYTLVHASGDPEEAEREIKLWFPDYKLD
jgi:nucleoside-diphosphate kinase